MLTSSPEGRVRWPSEMRMVRNSPNSWAARKNSTSPPDAPRRSKMMTSACPSLADARHLRIAVLLATKWNLLAESSDTRLSRNSCSDAQIAIRTLVAYLFKETFVGAIPARISYVGFHSYGALTGGYWQRPDRGRAKAAACLNSGFASQLVVTLEAGVSIQQTLLFNG